MATKNSDEHTPLQILETTFHVLRKMPKTAISFYYIGTFPFITYLLYFFFDMAYSHNAYQSIGRQSLFLAVFFLWMKTWQSLYCYQVKSQYCHISRPITTKLVLKTFYQTFLYQPLGLFLSILVFFYPYYLALTVSMAEEDVSPQTCKKLTKQHLGLNGPTVSSILTLFVIAFFLFINILVLTVQAPDLAKAFFDIEIYNSANILTSGHFWGTFIFFSGLAIFLLIDPLVKATYTIKVFKDISFHNGEDIKMELQYLKKIRQSLLLIVVLFCGFSAQAEAPTTPKKNISISAEDFDRQSDNTLNDRQFDRLSQRDVPLNKDGEPIEMGFIEDTLKGILNTLTDLKDWVSERFKGLSDWFEDFFKRNKKKSSDAPNPKKDTSSNWGNSEFFSAFAGMGGLFKYLILGVALIVFALVGYKVFKSYRSRAQFTKEDDGLKMTDDPDLNDENLVADQLEEEQWLGLADQMKSKGDLRLAMRAVYLSHLSYLGEKNIIKIKKFKSNLEYGQEIAGKKHVYPHILDPFQDNVLIYDQVWYGLYPISIDLLNLFKQNIQKVKTHVEK